MGITNMRETEWGWFTAREMAEIDMTPEQAEAARQIREDHDVIGKVRVVLNSHY